MIIMDQVTRKRISEMSTSFDDFNFSSVSEEVGLSTSEMAALLGGAMLSTPDADQRSDSREPHRDKRSLSHSEGEAEPGQSAMSFERSVTAMLETINSQLDYLIAKVEAQVLKRATPANSTRVEELRCVQSMPTGRCWADIPLDEPADYTVPLPWD